MIAAGHLNRKLGRMEIHDCEIEAGDRGMTFEGGAPYYPDSVGDREYAALLRGLRVEMPSQPAHLVSIHFALGAMTLAAIGGLVTGAIIGFALAPMVDVL